MFVTFKQTILSYATSPLKQETTVNTLTLYATLFIYDEFEIKYLNAKS